MGTKRSSECVLVTAVRLLCEEWLPRLLMGDYEISVYDNTMQPADCTVESLWDIVNKRVTFKLWQGFALSGAADGVLHELAHGVLYECGLPLSGDAVERMCDRLAEIWLRIGRQIES